MIWKPIPSCPNYEASEAGDIRRIGASKPRVSHVQENGYLKVNLWHGNKGKNHWVQRLVCEAFHGPPPSEDLDAAHRNGVRTDNRQDNLSWKTRRENTDDMVEHGTRRSGERCNTWLTETVVTEIRRRFAEAPRSISGKYVKKGELTKLAASFGMSREGVWQIVKRRSWKYV